MLGGGFVCRFLSAFLLVFCVLRLLLFCVWGGFFRGWGGCFGGWGAWFVSLFFVALLCSLVWCRGCSLVFFGFCRGGCCRLSVSPLLLCGFRARHPCGAWLASVGSGGCGVSCLRWCLGWSGVVFLVGGLVGGFLGRWFLGRVGVVGWGRCAWRSAFALLASPRLGSPLRVLVFVSFF